MQNIVRKLRTYDQNDSNNYMVFGDFNFIERQKDKKNGLSQRDKQINKVWVPFLEEMDLVDPFREQNPKRKVWSFIGSGVAGNSRIDRIYVKSINMTNITTMRYIHTPHGHRVLSFRIKNDNDWGKGYYKLNTSLLEDEEYEKIVDETVAELDTLNDRTQKEKWEIFLMTMKSKSIRYSTKRNNAKEKLKN